MQPLMPDGGEERIRLLLLDNHVLFRESLGRLLASEAGFEVLGECCNSAEALALLSRAPVNLALMDFDLGSEHGNEFIAAAHKAGYAGKFLVVTDVVDGNASAAAVQLGVSGIFLKSKSLKRLVYAIRLVAAGETWVDRAIIQLLAQRYPQREGFGKPLTGREQDVLNSVIQGLTNKGIGSKMGRSEGAVKAILQQLFAKAGVRSRSQLVRVAMDQSPRTGVDRAQAG